MVLSSDVETGGTAWHPTMASHDKMRLLEFGQQKFAQNTALSPDCIGKGQTAEFFTEKCCWIRPCKGSSKQSQNDTETLGRKTPFVETT